MGDSEAAVVSIGPNRPLPPTDQRRRRLKRKTAIVTPEKEPGKEKENMAPISRIWTDRQDEWMDQHISYMNCVITKTIELQRKLLQVRCDMDDMDHEIVANMMMLRKDFDSLLTIEEVIQVLHLNMRQKEVVEEELVKEIVKVVGMEAVDGPTRTGYMPSGKRRRIRGDQQLFVLPEHGVERLKQLTVSRETAQQCPEWVTKDAGGLRMGQVLRGPEWVTRRSS